MFFRDLTVNLNCGFRYFRDLDISEVTARMDVCQYYKFVAKKKKQFWCYVIYLQILFDDCTGSSKSFRENDMAI